MKVLLVDPSLFTEPYDAALSSGLEANGVRPLWALRGARTGEQISLPPEMMMPIFYPLTDGRRRASLGSVKLLKGVEHIAGLFRLWRLAKEQNAEVVHFQWATLPSFDLMAARLLRRTMPVVFTIHDITPFNGVNVNPLQLRGLDDFMREADHLIVHTETAYNFLIGRGLSADRIAIVAHGPLPLRCAPRPVVRAANRTRIVLFGKMQSYKGIDVLIEALGLVDEASRAQLEVIVAGEPLIELQPLLDRAAKLGLDARTLSIMPGRLEEQEMADLIGSADAFVYPYHAIEASGVFHLTANLGKWTIASDLGSFHRAFNEVPEAGRLVPPGDIAALADALKQCVGGAPVATPLLEAEGWHEIGARTRQIYETAIQRFELERARQT